MGKVKRYKCTWSRWEGAIMVEALPGEINLYRKDSDYARLERERDYLFSCLRDIAAENSEYVGTAELQAMAREACSDDAAERAHEVTQAELTRLRAVEAAAIELIRQSGDEFGHPDGTRLREVHDADLAALREACGRNG